TVRLQGDAGSVGEGAWRLVGRRARAQEPRLRLIAAMDSVEAFVLHARAYRESSQRVELLSVEHGRIGVLTRGNRGSRRAQPLQPFRRYRIPLSGRGELRRAGTGEAIGAPHLLGGHALYAALYLNELLVRLLHR